MSRSPVPPRIGRVAFSLGSFAAFLPAAVAAGYEAWRALDAMAAGLTLETAEALAASGGVLGAGMPDPYPGTGGGFAILLGVLGWAAFGWLAAGRSRDIGDPPALGFVAAVPALLGVLPGDSGPAAWIAAAGIAAWSLRLGFAKGVPPATKPRKRQVAAAMPRR